MRKGKNGQADLDKGFKTGYFSFFNHQACVFYLCDMNYRAVQEKRKHLKYQGFLPWNKGRSIGQSKKTVQYSYPCPYEPGLQSGYFSVVTIFPLSGGRSPPYESFTGNTILERKYLAHCKYAKGPIYKMSRISFGI